MQPDGSPRVLSLQVLTNFGFGVVVAGGLFAIGTPDPILWGLLAGTLRFIPYVGATLGAVLPSLIAFAVSPGWLQPVLVFAWIVGLDIFLGQIIEPLIFGESTGVTPLALILSALFWGMLWGPVGLLLSTPITICLLVVGRHVPHLGFLHVLLGDEPALNPYQQIYRRLIRKAVPEASTVALEEIEQKGQGLGLDDSLGRMVVLAEADRAADRLSADQIDAIVEGTDLVLDFLEDNDQDKPDQASGSTEAPLADDEAPAPRARAFIRCVGGRSQIDEAAASIIAFSLRKGGMEAARTRYAETDATPEKAAFTITLICYASHPSEAVRRYTSRKLRAGDAGAARHAIIDYDVAKVDAPMHVPLAEADAFVGDVASISRLAAQLVASISKLDEELSLQAAR